MNLLQVDIYVDIFKGMTPVINIEVKVTITTPTESVVELLLHDDGGGESNFQV